MLLLLAASYTQAQVVVNGVDINTLPDVKICQLVAFKTIGGKFRVHVEYGPKVKLYGKGAQLRDPATGKPRVFSSMPEAINFMENQGWEYIDSASQLNHQQTVTYYRFRRQAEA